jgi:hypothetical protein
MVGVLLAIIVVAAVGFLADRAAWKHFSNEELRKLFKD